MSPAIHYLISFGYTSDNLSGRRIDRIKFVTRNGIDPFVIYEYLKWMKISVNISRYFISIFTSFLDVENEKFEWIRLRK